MSYNASLYQKIILDHNRSPRNFGKLEQATHRCSGNNPLCGDSITVELILKGTIVTDICFESSSCAISKASASLMTETLKGKSLEEINLISTTFHKMFQQKIDPDVEEARLGDLISLENIKGTSSRIKCATLAWKTFHEALEAHQNATTEDEK